MRTRWKGSRSAMFLVGGAALSALACGGGGEKVAAPPQPCPSSANPVATVSVTAAAGTLESFGATTQLTASARDGGSRACTGVTFTFASSAQDVATVNASGLVTAVGNGSASITASAGGQSGAVNVQVTQKVASVAVTTVTSTLEALGATTQLSAVGNDANNHVVGGATFTWSSSAQNVITVTGSGLATAVGNGDAKITATADGKSGSADVRVAQKVASLAVTPGADTLEALGASVQLNAVARDANSNIVNGAAISWSSSAASVVSVNANGLARAVGNGAATVSAAIGPLSAGVNMLVAQRVASVSVSPATATVDPGVTQQFTASAKDANNNDVAVTFLWVSSNHNVAIVDQNGVAKGMNGGSATITAAGGGVPSSAALTVSPAPAPPPPPSATQLAFTVQPANAMVGAALSPAVEVEVRDADGKLVSSARNTVHLTIGTNAGGGNLSGTNVVNAVNGIASFPGLRLDQPGTGYTLVAHSGTLSDAISAGFNIAPRPAAAKLAFVIQPTNAMADQAISPAVQVEVRDVSGMRVRSARDAVTLAIDANPAGGTLSGTKTVNAVNGIASFAGLSLDQAGVGYTLVASSGSLTAETSAPFLVAPVLRLSKGSVAFSGVVGGPNPGSQRVTVTSTGGTAAELTASVAYGAGQPTGWLRARMDNSIAIPGGPDDLILVATIGTLVPGSYSATATVSSTTPGTVSRTVAVTFDISPPLLALSTESIAFSAVAGGGNPTAQVVDVESPDGIAAGLSRSIEYAPGQAAGWLNVAVLSQPSTPATLTLQAQTIGLAAGSYSATVTVASTTPGVVSKSLTVTFVVNPVVVTYGNSEEVSPLSFGVPANWLLGTRISVPQSITVTHLALISRSASPTQVKVGLYTDVGGNPGTLVAQAGPATLLVGRVEIPVTTAQSIPAGDYWIMAVPNAGMSVSGSLPAASYKFVIHTFTNALPTVFPSLHTTTPDSRSPNFYIKGTAP